MGYANYVLSDGREAGYAVDATCDHFGCDAEIHRGLDYLCGVAPGTEEGLGCGGYFCHEHLHIAPEGSDWIGGICARCDAAKRCETCHRELEQESWDIEVWHCPIDCPAPA